MEVLGPQSGEISVELLNKSTIIEAEQQQKTATAHKTKSQGQPSADASQHALWEKEIWMNNYHTLEPENKIRLHRI